MAPIRLARAEDAHQTIEVVRSSIEVLCAADHRHDPATLGTWLANKTPDDFLGWLANPDNHCVVAESGGKITGVGLLHRSGEIRLFYMAADVQRQGIGRAIHAALQQAANDWGLASLHLESTLMARPFYEALGYLPAGSTVHRFGVLQCYPYIKQLKSSH